MNIQKNTYIKLWALCLSSVHTPRKSELITHGICTYGRNSGCFTHFLAMAFHTLPCNGLLNLMTCRNVQCVWNICSIFLENVRLKTLVVLINFSRWGHEQRPVLWTVLLMSAFNQHFNVSKYSKFPHYHIYENPLSGSTVVMSHTERHGEASKLHTR